MNVTDNLISELIASKRLTSVQAESIARGLFTDSEDSKREYEVKLALSTKAVEWYELSKVLFLAEKPPVNLTANGLTEAEEAFIKGGQKISAIKAIRERLHLSLKEAKDMADVVADKFEAERQQGELAKLAAERVAQGQDPNGPFP